MQSTKAEKIKPAKSSHKVATRAGILLAGVLLGASLMRWYDSTEEKTNRVVSEFGQPLHPGPWGEIYSTSFTIAAPEELLPIRKLEESGTIWAFPRSHYSEVERLLESTGLPTSLRAELMEPGVLSQPPAGMEMRPAAKTLLALPAGPRKRLYQALIREESRRLR